MATESPHLFDVILTKEGQAQTIGRAEADPGFKLKVIAAVEDQRQFLEETFQRLNQKEVLHAKIPPPAGAARFTLYSRLVGRSEPDFLPELQEYLKTYYDLTLQPATAQ